MRMRRVLLALTFLVMALAPFAARAEAPRLGGALVATPRPAAEPTLDAEYLFGDLFAGETAQPGPTPNGGGVLGGLLDRFKGRTPPPDAAATPEPSRPSALFDDGVRQITGAVWGGAVDYAYVGGWTVSRGYFDGRYCITGIPPSGGAREALTDSGPPTFVSTGDAIVYYGEATKGDYAWLSLVPGERVPLKLPLDASAEVFYADGEYIWYYTYGKGESATIGRMAHDGSKKNKVGSIKGSVVSMLPGNRLLLVNFGKNRVQTWSGGEYQTIYQPEQPILSVTTSGSAAWVGHDDGFGLLEDGAVRFWLPGRIVGAAGSTDQFAVLALPYEEADYFNVYLLNEVYRAYAPMGWVPRSDSAVIEFLPDQLIVWGPEQSLAFEYPPADAWLPYGYYDIDSARNYVGDAAWAQLLVGSWCAEPSVGDGYGERLIFTADELYRLPAQRDGGGARASLWAVDGGRLIDYVDRDVPRRRWLAGPFAVMPEESPYGPRISIDGVSYYQYAADPAYFDDLDDYGISIGG